MKIHRILILVIALAFFLRAFLLDQYPPGLYSDEAAFGYNAYSLWKSGHDEFGRFWPVSFESFGDWKPPMSGWLAIPMIAFFGLNELAVRLPSAILGTATVVVIYFLTKNFLRSDSGVLQGQTISDFSESAALLAALLLAINPWHIFMSRISMLVGIEVFFVSLGVLALLMGRRKREERGRKINWWWMCASASFVGAIYSYYGSRVTVPLLCVTFGTVFFKELKSRWKELMMPMFIGALLLFPLFVSFAKEPSVLFGRAKTTSVFYNDNIRLMLWDAHTRAGLKSVPPLLSRFFDNKLYYYTRNVLARWLQHFSPSFLFFSGSSYPPFRIPRLGYLHLIDFPFFMFGAWLLRKKLYDTQNRQSGTLFLLLYVLISPFVASLTFMTPAANRSFNMVIPWTMVTAFGITRTIRILPSIFSMIISTLYVLSFAYFSYSYFYFIPYEQPLHYWHYGRRELVSKLLPLLAQYPLVYMSDRGGPPYIFLAFYGAVHPDLFLETIVRDEQPDELGWRHTHKILNITVIRDFYWPEVLKDQHALYVGFEQEIDERDVDVIDRVYYPNGLVAYTIATIK